jgi:hypothetical protein
MLTLWAFSCICFFASLIYIFLQYVIPVLWDKFQEKLGFKIAIYNFYKYQFEFSADKVQGGNRKLFVTSIGSIEKCNINVIRVLPKISWSRINKHWFTIEIQDLSLIVDGRKVKENKNKKNKVKEQKVKKTPNKLNKKLKRILKSFINSILNIEALHYILNNIIKYLFAFRIKNVDIRYITPQSTLINYRQENFYIYSGIDSSSSITVDSKNFKCQEFFIRVLISPFSINHYRNIKLLPNEDLVYNFNNYLTDPVFEKINRIEPLLKSEEYTEIILKWTGKVNYRRNIEFTININGFTFEINEIKNMMKILKQSDSNNTNLDQESSPNPSSNEISKPADSNLDNKDIINYDTIETVLDYLDSLNIHLKFNINRLAVNKTNNKLYALPSILATLNKLSFEISLISIPETERQIIVDSTFEIYDFVIDIFNGKMSAIYLENNQMQIFRLPYFSIILNNSSIKDIRKMEDVFNFCSLFQVLIDTPEINLCETYISMALEEALVNKNTTNEITRRNTRSLSFSSATSSIEDFNEVLLEENENKPKSNPLSSMGESQTKVILTLLEYLTVYSTIHIVNPSIKIRLSKNTTRSHLPEFPSHHFLVFASHIDEIYIKGIIHSIVSNQECRVYLEKLRTNKIDKQGNNNSKGSLSIFNPDKSVLYNILNSDLYDPDSNVNFNITFKNFFVDTKLIKQGDIYDLTYNNEKDLHMDNFQINLNISLPKINRYNQLESAIPTKDDLRTDVILYFNMNELSINMANSLATTKYYLIFATSLMKWKTILDNHKIKTRSRDNTLSSYSEYNSRRNTITFINENEIIKLEEEKQIIQNGAIIKKNKKINEKEKRILTLDEILKIYTSNVKLSTDCFLSKIGCSILDLYDTSGVNLEILDIFLWLKFQQRKLDYLYDLDIEESKKERMSNLEITEQLDIPLSKDTINNIEGHFSMNQICGYIQDSSKWNEPENMQHRFLRLTHLEGNINNGDAESPIEKKDIIEDINDNDMINIEVDLEKLEIFYSINIHYALFATFVSLTKWGNLIKSKINIPYVKHKRNLSYINNVNLTKKRRDSRVEHVVELESIPSAHNIEKIEGIPKKKNNIQISLRINEFNGELELPNDIRLYLFIKNTNVNTDKNNDIGVSIKGITIMVPPQIDGDRDFLSVTKINVKVYKKLESDQQKGKLVIDINGEKISMTVPFGYIISDIIENGVNMFKATKQIAVRLVNTVVNHVTHINPNSIPELNVFFDIFLIIFLDQKFESKLGRNYKESFSEQIGRLARDIAFNKKVEGLKSVFHQEQLKKNYADNRNMEESGNSIIENRLEREKIYIEQNLTKDQLNTINNSSDVDSYGNTSSTLTNSNLDLNYQQLEKRIDSIWYLLQEMNSKLWIKRINKLKNEEFKPMSLGKMTNVIIRLRPPELLAPTIQETINIIDDYCSKDARYDLLVPLNIFVSVSSFSINFRDYPIPFVDIPIIPNRPDLPSLTLSGLLIIAEQEAFKESIRYVKVPIFPNTEPVHVSRTINPIKMYTRLKLTCSSPDRTFISWGFSIDPCLTDMIRVIDGFTKVNVDISENIIWWDKVRLNMHGRFGLDFVGGSNLHIRLLGSLSPYFNGLHHSGTDGIEFVFSKGASVTLGDTGIPNTQIYINCGEFKCVVPRAKYENVINPSESLLNKVIDQIDEETVLRFSGDVRLSVGFEFVPICDEYFDKPRKHNEIVLKVPQHAELYPNTKKFDSYAGFRSKEILVSLFIASPPPLFSSLNYPLNSLHLSPFSLNHITSLMPYFSSPIGSLPIRIGKIFNVMLPRKRPASFKSVTLKAYLLPAVLGYVNGMNVNEGCVGLRIRSQNADISICWKKVDREIIDDYNDIPVNNDSSKNQEDQVEENAPQFVTQKWVIQSSKVTFTTVEGRTVGLGSWVKEMNKLNENDEIEEVEKEQNNYSGMDDVETDESEWMTDYDFFCIRNNYPLKMEKFIWAPRVIYYKRKYEPEPSSLLMSDDQLLEKEIKRTQVQLAQNRYLEIKQEIGKLLEVQNEIENKLKAVQEGLNESDEENLNEKLMEQSMEVTNQINVLLEKRNTLGNYLKNVNNVNTNIYSNSSSNSNLNVRSNAKRMSFITPVDHNQSLPEKQSQFNYYYIIHNIKLIYKTSVRNTIFKLLDLRSQESAMSYFTSNALMRRIKQLLVVDDKKNDDSIEFNGVNDPNDPQSMYDKDDHITTQYYEQKLAQDLLNHLINEQYDNNIVPNELSNSDGPNAMHRHKTVINNRNIMALDSYYPSRDPDSPDFVPPNNTFFGSYVVHLLNPQINFELRSKIHPNQYESVVLAAEAAQYKSIRIMDGRCNTQHFTSALNHRLIKTRNILNVQNSQLFLTQKGEVEEILPEWNKYDNNNKPRVPWPLWCPLECLILEQNSSNSYGYLSRIVNKISFSWHSASPNSLYINKPMDKNSMQPQSESNVNDDLVPIHHVTFPEFALTANSTQYSILYNIIMDLIVYSEPAQKQRQEKIQSMLLALGQLEDISTILDSVQQLQNIIKSLDAKLKYGSWDETEESFTATTNNNNNNNNDNDSDNDSDETKNNFNTIGRTYNYSVNNEKYMEICSQLLEAKEELYIVIEALKIYHTRNRNKYNMKISSRLILSADKVCWTMIAGNNDKICQCDISNIVLETQSQEDQTSIKKVGINEILLINLMEDESSHFRKALSFYNPKNKNYDFNRHQMFRTYWREIAPVGGIAIVEHFEINMLPIELRLTYDLGRKLIFYAFPEKDKQSTHIYALNELTIRYNRKFENSPFETSNSNESLNDLMDNPSTENLKAEFMNDEVSTPLSAVKENENDNNPQENKSLDASSRNSSSENLSGMANQNKSSKNSKSTKKISGNQLTQMRTRATKNKTFIYIKVPSVQHCLSYKGSKIKNIVDLYDFTFKLPTMEFRNKTWTWLDLLMNVKKMVISTILSHTGSLVKTKISQLRKGGYPYADGSKNDLLTVHNSHNDNLKSVKSESDLLSLDRRKAKKSSSVDNYPEYHIEGDNVKFDIGININEINNNNDDIYNEYNNNSVKEDDHLKIENEKKLKRKTSSTSELSFNSESSNNTNHNGSNNSKQKADTEDLQKRLLLFGKFERERKYSNTNSN